MKKLLVFGILLFTVLFSINAQGFYFNAEAKLGGAWTKLDGKDPKDLFFTDNTNISIATGLGLKAGYGFF